MHGMLHEFWPPYECKKIVLILVIYRYDANFKLVATSLLANARQMDGGGGEKVLFSNFGSIFWKKFPLTSLSLPLHSGLSRLHPVAFQSPEVAFGKDKRV